jgi:hypothetical protein
VHSRAVIDALEGEEVAESPEKNLGYHDITVPE